MSKFERIIYWIEFALDIVKSIFSKLHGKA